jgi:hypothetical protein
VEEEELLHLRKTSYGLGTERPAGGVHHTEVTNALINFTIQTTRIFPSVLLDEQQYSSYQLLLYQNNVKLPTQASSDPVQLCKSDTGDFSRYT